MKKLFVTLIFFLSLMGIYHFIVPERGVDEDGKEVSKITLINKIKEGSSSKNTEQEPEKKNIKIDRITRNSIGESLKLEGLLAPEEVYNVHTEAPIIIKEVLVNEGDEVEKGQKLLTFEDSYREEVLRQLKSIQLDMDNAALELRNMSSGSLQLELDNKRLEGQEVKEAIVGLNKKKKHTTV